MVITQHLRQVSRRLRPAAKVFERLLLSRTLGLTVVITAGLALGAHALYARTYVREVAYGPCNIQYGQEVASWRGSSDDAWDQQGFHYVTRVFQIESHAPDPLLPNVAERSPKHITSSPSHSKGEVCQEGFSGLVDTQEDSLRWHGARAVSARLGAPDINRAQYESGHIPTADITPNKNVQPPVYGTGGKRAAVMVDDGARAVLQTVDEQTTHQLWCYGMPAGHVSDCARPAAETPQRSNGYLFTADNCPEVFRRARSSCEQATRWYRQVDLTQLAGTNNRDEVRPFSLHLEARSTYAPDTGAWMAVTFKYPAQTSITPSLKADKTKIDPAGSVTFQTTLTKTGPDVASLSLRADASQQPVSPSGWHRALTAAELRQLNRRGSLSLQAAHTVAGDATRNQCYDYTVSVDTPATVQVQEATTSYCVTAKREVTYRYGVRSLGNLRADFQEFKQQARETLNDARGWASAGITFVPVDTGADFTLYLATPQEVNAASSGCNATYSCRVGNAVYINEQRWRQTTPSWRTSGGSLRGYRHMVVNHEVGHWLGFGHLNCPQSGNPAPVMQQQSIDLAGCTHNAWPTSPELAALQSRLGL